MEEILLAAVALLSVVIAILVGAKVAKMPVRTVLIGYKPPSVHFRDHAIERLAKKIPGMPSRSPERRAAQQELAQAILKDVDQTMRSIKLERKLKTFR